MNSWIRLCLTAGVALVGTAVQADEASRPVVIELFTAQGCSSCPPADAYLGQLSERPGVLALAFHVDYWDSSGWRDRFELRQAVERQNVYVRNFRRPSAFTPQFVIDGRKDAIDTPTIVQALSEPRVAVPVTLAVDAGQLVVDVGEKQGERASDVVLVTYLRHAETSVRRGENSGKSLEEFNIVRSIRTLGEWKGAAANYKVSASSLPSDATDVAVLVQTHGEGPIVGAAAKPLH
ncbi:MAG TPA: DUF1223 domain-containing protein [Steroidobacteraceae bacterium]|jgi:hypothetical protein|nr:DUF1223 domain-containing protein [Steroidobacteraceae bacterium]